MAMGSTGKVVINGEMQAAKGVCSSFRSEVATFLSDLNSTVDALFASGFQGEAANGFRFFYENNVKAFLDNGGTFDNFMKMFDEEGTGLFDSIEKALISTNESLDPSLGENNKSVGQSAATPAQQ